MGLANVVGKENRGESGLLWNILIQQAKGPKLLDLQGKPQDNEEISDKSNIIKQEDKALFLPFITRGEVGALPREFHSLTSFCNSGRYLPFIFLSPVPSLQIEQLFPKPS